MINWFTSDTHFGHGNIMKYCKRVQFMNARERDVMARGNEEEIKNLRLSPESVHKMDEALTDLWNARVKKDDTVYFLGDFCFKHSSEAPNANPFEFYKDRLNGRIVFICGNHDNRNRAKSILQSGLIDIGGSQVYLVHDPKHANPKYSLVFNGHVHEKWQFKQIGHQTFVNVGVDVWNFQPVDINQINKALCKWRRSYVPDGTHKEA